MNRYFKKRTIPYFTVSICFSLGSSGYVDLYINGWVHISFCLPHKIYTCPDGKLIKVWIFQSFDVLAYVIVGFETLDIY